MTDDRQFRRAAFRSPRSKEVHRDVEDQPPPVPNERPAIVDLVVDDMLERKRVGTERYGTPLQPFNGRRSLVDAYQEALDLTMYLRQRIYEDEHPAEKLAAETFSSRAFTRWFLMQDRGAQADFIRAQKERLSDLVTIT